MGIVVATTEPAEQRLGIGLELVDLDVLEAGEPIQFLLDVDAETDAVVVLCRDSAPRLEQLRQRPFVAELLAVGGDDLVNLRQGATVSLAVTAFGPDGPDDAVLVAGPDAEHARSALEQAGFRAESIAPAQPDIDAELGPVVTTHGGNLATTVKLFALTAVAAAVALGAAYRLTLGGSGLVVNIFVIVFAALTTGFLTSAALANARLRLDVGQLGLRLTGRSSAVTARYIDVRELRPDQPDGDARELVLVLSENEQLRLTDELAHWPDVVAAVTKKLVTTNDGRERR